MHIVATATHRMAPIDVNPHCRVREDERMSKARISTLRRTRSPAVARAATVQPSPFSRQGHAASLPARSTVRRVPSAATQRGRSLLDIPRIQRAAGADMLAQRMPRAIAISQQSATIQRQGDNACSGQIPALDLAANAQAAAQTLCNAHPTVVFTSGRRTVEEQASAMASNIVASSNRNWIADTYAQSDERDALQTWVDEHTEATTQTAIAAGLLAIMNQWTDAQRRRISRHLSGQAFDIQPTTDDVWQTVQGLPNLRYSTQTEGGLVRWHADFN